MNHTKIIAILSLVLIIFLPIAISKNISKDQGAASLRSGVSAPITSRTAVNPINVLGVGDIYVADTQNNRIQKFDSSGNYVLQWGSLGTGNGQFNNPYAVTTDSSGNVYVVDTANSRIQKFDSNGNYLTQWGNSGTGNGQFGSAYGVAVNYSGDVYVIDTANNRIQKFNSNGGYVDQWGSLGTGNGQFKWPQGNMAIDALDNIYITDTGNHRIQKFNSNGVYITQWGTQGSGNGQFDNPIGITIDTSGNLYVLDNANSRVQKFNSNGVYITQWGMAGTGNGQFSYPSNIGSDLTGNIYVVDGGNHRIQKFDSNGNYLTQWGSVGIGSSQFAYPSGVAIDKTQTPPCQVTVLTNTMPTLTLTLGQQVIGRFSATGCPSNVVMERVQVRTSQSTGNLRITKPTIVDTSTGVVSPASNVISNSLGAVTGISFKPSFPLTTNPNIGVVYEVRADVVGVLSPGDTLQTEVINIVATDLSTAQPAIITPSLPLPPQVLTF